MVSDKSKNSLLQNPEENLSHVVVESFSSSLHQHSHDPEMLLTNRKFFISRSQEIQC